MNFIEWILNKLELPLKCSSTIRVNNKHWLFSVSLLVIKGNLNSFIYLSDPVILRKIIIKPKLQSLPQMLGNFLYVIIDQIK